MNRFRIFIDMDGVVADWYGKAIKTFGLNVRSRPVFETLSNNIRGLEDIIDETFMWNTINAAGSDWWSSIEPFPWATKLVRILDGMGDICFLSQPGIHPSSAYGKIEWINKHFPWANKKVLIGAPKHLCAGRYSVLIDDSPQNTNNFKLHGGNVVEFPNSFKIQHECNFDDAYLIAERVDDLITDICNKVRLIMTKVKEEDSEKA